jgi:hypothetical protein
VGTGLNGVDHKDFYSYNPVTDHWSQIADFPGPPRNSGAAFAIDSLGFCGLGYNNITYTYYNDFYKYNPITNSWSVITFYPEKGRTYPLIFVVGNKGYVGTGRNTNNTNIYYKDFYRLSLSTVGVDELLDEIDFHWNISDGKAFFQFDNSKLRLTRFELFDITGKLLMEQKIDNSGTFEFNCDQLEHAVYVYRIYSGNNFKSSKILL